MEGSSRDRSPLRHPAATNNAFQSFNTSEIPFTDYTAQDNTFNNLDQAQFLTDPTFNPFSQQTGIDETNSVNYDHLSPHSLSNQTSPVPEGVSFPTYDYDPNAIDTTLINDIDYSFQQPGTNYTNNSIDMSAAMNTHSPTPPHLLPNMARNSSSPSPRASPNTQHAFFNRPRNTSETLDPSSANYPPPQHMGDWSQVAGYNRHRRMHSDNLSDISSQSNNASPYLGTMDNFDAQQASPLLNATQDPTFNDGLGIGHFSINDAQNYHSPGHSPHISPNLVAQQPLPQFNPADSFMLSQYVQPAESFQQEPFPSLQGAGSPNEIGQADHMSPPEISIHYAPPSKPILPTRPSEDDASLVPPMRTNRTRAKSDSYAGGRPTAPTMPARGRSPSLQPGEALSPFASNPSSREPSPVRGRNGSLSARVRSISAASDQREYVLGLADPDRSPSTGGDRRQQKHPATFQCHLCPKRFTRAYNLRSHLRTHTDERPFVCTVCSKAFARQHDRKRHEGLHSGEKKFVCRGPLKNPPGGQWGCNRRFARADALGRHFRSEAGRVCIKPLLDEEAIEQQAAMWQEQQAQVGAGFAPQMSMESQMTFFPQAILQQYPALAGIDWNQPQANIAEEEYAGRSSYDASSGGEMYDELSENEMGIGSMSVNTGYAMPMQQQQQQHQMNSYNNHQMSDFTNGFEGR